MTRWIIDGSLKFRVLVVGLAAALVVFGIARLRNTPVDVLPEYTLPYVEIQTESLGLSAAEVEQFITVPLEQDLLNGVKGVETIRSDSVPGVSSIVLVFERGTDLLRARQLVGERLSQPHAFPNISKPPLMLQPVSASNRVMMVGLSSARLSALDLSVLARWTIRPRLVGIPGVANVAIWGHRDRQLQVLVDPRRLRAQNVSLLKVIETTGNAQLVSPLSFLDASTPGTGGFIDGPNQRLSVRHILPFGKPSDLAQVPIEETKRRLGDVATVVEDHQPLIGDAIVNGGSGLLLVVEKLPGANTLQVTRRLDEALAGLRRGLPGVRIDASVHRPATYIEHAIGNLGRALLIAGALVLLALTAFLRRWRTVLIAMVAIPLSLVAALVALDLRGATINALVVGGLAAAVAVLVADAVGDTHAIAAAVRKRRAAGDRATTASTLAAAAHEVRGGMGYATLIVLLSAAAVLFMGGLTGAFVRPMAQAYALAVLASMAVALTVTPALALLLLARERPGRGRPRWLAALATRYGLAILRFARTPRAALLVLAVLALGGAVAIAMLGRAERPSFRDRELLVRWNATPSTSLPEMRRITARAVEELRSTPGIVDVGAHVGRAVSADEPVGTGAAEMWLTMDDGAGYDRTLAAIRRVVEGYPGVRGRVLTPESDRTGGVLRPAGDGITVRVYGQSLGVLQRKARELRGVLSRIDGIGDPRVVPTPTQPTIQIEVDLGAARRHGIKPGDVRRATATLVSGLEVGNFFEQQKVFSVVVRGVPSTRSSVDSVRALLLDTPTGGHVRLGDVARVRLVPNPVDIRHDAVSRYVDVRAGVAGRDMGDVRRDVQRRLAGVSFPLEYHPELLPQPADARAGAGFPALIAASAIGIFLLLQAAFGSWRLAALLLATVPAALAGGVLVAVANGRALALGEIAGLFAVFAIAIRLGIALVRGLQREQAEGRRPDLGGVLRGADERLAPTVATLVTAAAALAPLALLGDVPGNEITQPMAIVVLGGLLTTAAMSLFVWPALHLHYAPAAAPAATDTPPPPATTREPELQVRI